jgi:hypothetical protein
LALDWNVQDQNNVGTVDRCRPASVVHQASPNDPLVLAGVVVTMMLVGALATWIPARRVLSIDPIEVLREQ